MNRVGAIILGFKQANLYAIVAGVGGLLYKIPGYNHAFSLEDPSISYPLVANTISITIVGIVACGVPAVVIFVLCLLIPSSTIQASSPGLGLSLAGAFFITSGLKDVVEKPRPDFLARCDQDLSNVAAYMVGGLGLEEASAPILVNISTCQNTDLTGLLYLSLWLSIKFAVTFPVPFRVTSSREPGEENADIVSNIDQTPFRSAAAAPPLYLLLLVFAPVVVALFICATRYADYMHAGWDILGGSLIGIFFAWAGFRMYQVPPRGGEFQGYAGWAWAPRSARGAFGVRFWEPNFGRNGDSIRKVQT
ncbi:diacylglycerol pyrophosphate phosphatase [Penicillium cosmopolitanum]|uniref:Diacylglycerol pyrophosphate phosphatase n=1 Tax=Penicillium cosmopolitanum TaxID=1131564 RepID=A0A9W9SER2_9EURO|nr:diacylglycerol pyrophosphate phosphatase [Penicillium cosmopolitanum]KAJ5375889.1 diacylglycerol pyrophosphate phosphatase [Penicillium cosmopolitanum]